MADDTDLDWEPDVDCPEDSLCLAIPPTDRELLRAAYSLGFKDKQFYLSKMCEADKADAKWMISGYMEGLGNWIVVVSYRSIWHDPCGAGGAATNTDEVKKYRLNALDIYRLPSLLSALSRELTGKTRDQAEIVLRSLTYE